MFFDIKFSYCKLLDFVSAATKKSKSIKFSICLLHLTEPSKNIDNVGSDFNVSNNFSWFGCQTRDILKLKALM